MNKKQEFSREQNNIWEKTTGICNPNFKKNQHLFDQIKKKRKLSDLNVDISSSYKETQSYSDYSESSEDFNKQNTNEIKNQNESDQSLLNEFYKENKQIQYKQDNFQIDSKIEEEKLLEKISNSVDNQPVLLDQDPQKIIQDLAQQSIKIQEQIPKQNHLEEIHSSSIQKVKNNNPYYVRKFPQKDPQNQKLEWKLEIEQKLQNKGLNLNKRIVDIKEIKKNQKAKKNKHRTIKEVLILICEWKNIQDKGTKSLEQAATILEVPRKSLEDYTNLTRIALRNKVPIRDIINNQMGELRKIVQPFIQQEVLYKKQMKAKKQRFSTTLSLEEKNQVENILQEIEQNQNFKQDQKYKCENEKLENFDQQKSFQDQEIIFKKQKIQNNE